MIICVQSAYAIHTYGRYATSAPTRLEHTYQQSRFPPTLGPAHYISNHAMPAMLTTR